jgi:hypothetical protein
LPGVTGENDEKPVTIVGIPADIRNKVYRLGRLCNDIELKKELQEMSIDIATIFYVKLDWWLLLYIDVTSHLFNATSDDTRKSKLTQYE